MSLGVLDSSAALAWVLPGEGAETIAALRTQAIRQGVTVPALWQTEITNVLLMAERRLRITRIERDDALDALLGLPLTIDPPGMTARAVLHHATAHGLTAYDATYLELAARRRLPLLTLDRALQRAAGAAGVALLVDG